MRYFFSIIHTVGWYYCVPETERIEGRLSEMPDLSAVFR